MIVCKCGIKCRTEADFAAHLMRRKMVDGPLWRILHAEAAAPSPKKETTSLSYGDLFVFTERKES
jgi:hypothetical protein